MKARQMPGEDLARVQDAVRIEEVLHALLQRDQLGRLLEDLRLQAALPQREGDELVFAGAAGLAVKDVVAIEPDGTAIMYDLIVEGV